MEKDRLIIGTGLILAAGLFSLTGIYDFLEEIFTGWNEAMAWVMFIVGWGLLITWLADNTGF